MIRYFNYLFQMTSDICSSLQRIYALAVFEYRLKTKGMILGQVWKILNPVIQIGVYWLVFGLGIRSGDPIDGVPYVVWLTCGLTPWRIMNQSILSSASSIYSKASMLTRANIPTCLVPLSIVTSEAMDGVWMIILLLVIFLGNGCALTFSALSLLYYFVCMIIFSGVCSLITSVLVMLARDFQKLIQAVMRMCFFLSPVFWKPGYTLPEIFLFFDACNPFAYVIRGFRNSLLYNIPFWSDLRGMAIFWAITIAFYLIGAGFQSKLRKNLLDFI